MNDPIIGIFENSKRAKDWTDTYSWLNQPTTYEMSDAAIKKIVKEAVEETLAQLDNPYRVTQVEYREMTREFDRKIRRTTHGL